MKSDFLEEEKSVEGRIHDGPTVRSNSEVRKNKRNKCEGRLYADYYDKERLLLRFKTMVCPPLRREGVKYWLQSLTASSLVPKSLHEACLERQGSRMVSGVHPLSPVQKEWTIP
jgi:hypothetical protein